MNDERPTHLDLFSGIGGFALAAKWAGFRTIGFCEIEPYARSVIGQNFGAVENTRGERFDSRRSSVARRKGGTAFAGHASPTIHDNIFTLDGTGYRGVNLLTGGFPCQPFSVAGKRRGAADDRHLWPEMLRVIAEARPAWVLGENVPGIIPMELDNVLSDLEGIGYACRPFVIPACAVDARHRRDRLWVVGRDVADRHEPRLALRGESQLLEQLPTAQRNGFDPNADHAGITPGRDDCRMGRARQPISDGGDDDPRRWLPEPDVGRVAHGVSRRVDRLKGLGNAIVPQVAYEILREIRALI